MEDTARHRHRKVEVDDCSSGSTTVEKVLTQQLDETRIFHTLTRRFCNRPRAVYLPRPPHLDVPAACGRKKGLGVRNSLAMADSEPAIISGEFPVMNVFEVRKVWMVS